MMASVQFHLYFFFISSYLYIYIYIFKKIYINIYIYNGRVLFCLRTPVPGASRKTCRMSEPEPRCPETEDKDCTEVKEEAGGGSWVEAVLI